MKKYILLPCLFLTLLSCENNVENDTDGRALSAQISTPGNRSYDLTGFHSLDISSAMEVVLHQSDQYELKFEGDERLLKRLRVRQESGELKIGMKGSFNLGNNKGITVHISAPEYRKIEVSGACAITADQPLSGDQPFKIDISGAGSVDLDVRFPELTIESSGASNIEMKGTTRRLLIDGSGATNFDCKDLKADTVRVELSGVGAATVWAVQAIDIEVSGVGSVSYKGSPAVVNKSISGGGSVDNIR